MTSSNRWANRLILFVLGVVALAAAAALAWRPVTGESLPLLLPDGTAPGSLALVAAAGVAIAVFTVIWITTRGRGRTSLAIRTAEVQVDAVAVESLIRARLSSSPDVAGVRVGGYRVRGERMLLLTVQARRHPDLVSLKNEIAGAVGELDAALGTSIPLAVHITTGVRTALGGSRTTH